MVFMIVNRKVRLLRMDLHNNNHQYHSQSVEIEKIMVRNDLFFIIHSIEFNNNEFTLL